MAEGSCGNRKLEYKIFIANKVNLSGRGDKDLNQVMENRN